MEMREGVNAVLPPAILKVVCSFGENRRARYQVYWGNAGEPGPYTLKLLNGTAELTRKTGIYGSAASVEAELPEGASCFLQLEPQDRPMNQSLRVPSSPLCKLEAVICEREEEDQVSLRLKYQLASPLPEQLLASLDGGEGKLRLVPLKIFENRIDLGALGLADRAACVVRLGGAYQERGTMIETEPDVGSAAEVSLVRPKLSELSVELKNGQINLTGKLAADGEGQWRYRIYGESWGTEIGGEFAARLQADKRTLTCSIPWSSFPLGRSQGCRIAAVCQKGPGTFPESARMVLPLSEPRTEAVGYADSDHFFLQLAETGGEPGVCRAFFGSQTVEFSQGRLTGLFSEGKSVMLAWISGASRGPLTKAISLELPSYRIGQGKKDQAFLYFSKDASSASKTPISVNLRLQKALTAPVTQGVFSVGAAVEGVSPLTMSEKVWPDHSEYDWAQVEKDSEALFPALETAGLGASDLRLIRETIADFLPQLLNRQLFYRFRLRRRSCDLLPGMRVRVECGQVQWSDDTGGSGYFTGFTGGQTLELPVIRRGERLGLDAFLPWLSGYADFFEQPDENNNGYLPGGAGTVDLGREQLCQPHLRIHYPENFLSHTKQGDISIMNNEWVAGAESLEILERDTKSMEQWGYLTPPAGEKSKMTYLVFLRGRAHLTPEICVQVKENPQWVSVGTTLGDLRRELSQDLVLIRKGTAAEPVLSAEELLNEICLAPGDQLVDRGSNRVK